MKELNDKAKINISFLPSKIVTDKTEILEATKIANKFNNFFTNTNLKLAKKNPESSQPFDSYMENISSKMENKLLSIKELKYAFFLHLKVNNMHFMIKKHAFHDDISYNVVINVLEIYVPC